MHDFFEIYNLAKFLTEIKKEFMKKLALLSVILILTTIFIPSSKAQTPLTEGGGAAIPKCSAPLSTPTLIRNNDKSALFYLETYSPNVKLQYQGLVTYNKTTGTAFEEDIQLPEGYHHLYTRAIGTELFGYYYRYNAEKKSFDYSVARYPIKKNVDGVRVLTPENRLSVDLTGRGEILKYVAVSPDDSKYAMIFIVPNDRNQAPYFYCYIYDNTGKEIWYDKFLPTIAGNKFSIQDIELSDKGELLLLVYATKGKNATIQNPTVQLFSCTHGNISSITETLDFGFVNSMKMLRLANKDIFIGGYYDETQQSNTTGYFTFVVKEEPLRITEKSHAPFDKTQGNEYYGLSNSDYYVKCDYLFEMPDHIVAMIGEQYASIQQHSEKSAMAYRHHTNDIFCNRFTLNGTDLGCIKVNRHASAQASEIVTTHDDGERIAAFRMEEKTARPKAPTFYNLGLGYVPVVKGSEIFILYTDLLSNYAEDSEEWNAAEIETPDKNCLVVTRMDYSTDKKVIMLPNKAGQTFHDVWLVDGEDIYFGMSGKKTYTIEKFKLNKKWSWDK